MESVRSVGEFDWAPVVLGVSVGVGESAEDVPGKLEGLRLILPVPVCLSQGFGGDGAICSFEA